MADENNPFSKENFYRIMSQVPIRELQEAHKDLAKRAAFTGEEYNQVFEVDGQEVSIPLRVMHDYIEENKEKNKRLVQETFTDKFSKLRNEVRPSPSFAEQDMEPMDEEENFGDNDSEYYWDTNYNYEYMNPESVKRQVLGKIKP